MLGRGAYRLRSVKDPQKLVVRHLDQLIMYHDRTANEDVTESDTDSGEEQISKVRTKTSHRTTSDHLWQREAQ